MIAGMRRLFSALLFTCNKDRASHHWEGTYYLIVQYMFAIPVGLTKRGSYMSAHVLFNLLNELGKR